MLFAIADEAVAGELVARMRRRSGRRSGGSRTRPCEVRRGAQGTFASPGRGADRGRLSASDVAGAGSAAAHACRRGEPYARARRAVHGVERDAAVSAAKTGGYLYQAHLRAEISERLGLEWGPVRKGAAELKDVPQEALEEFSRRRHEMQRAAAEGGFSLGSKRSAEAAAVDTRERKQYGIETHTWREEIQARAAEHGLGRDEVAEILERGANQRERAERADGGALDESAGAAESRELRALGDRLAGPEGLTERSNTFDERAVLQEFAQAAGQGARVGVVRGRADRFGHRDDVLPTRDGAMTTESLSLASDA